MKFCPVDRCVNPDDALRCRSCGHVFKKGGKKDLPLPTLSLEPGAKPAPARSRSRAAVPAEEAGGVQRIGSPRWSGPLLQRLDAEGRPGETFCLQAEPLILGRSEGLLTFPDDPLLSPAHVSVRCDGVQAFLRDLKSRSGTFLRTDRIDVFDGLECLLGESLLRWTRKPGASGWQVTVSRAGGASRTLAFDGGFTIGRKGRDLELDDPTVSPLHAKVRAGAEGATLVDAKSLNGIFYRIPAERNEVVESGGMFRAGRQLLRFELRGP